MSTRKRVKRTKNPYKQILHLYSAMLKRVTHRLLRSLPRQNRSRSGFVLPTVIMVSLVVVLLTSALLMRSFERSKNANNVRLNQAVLNAAAPGISRARAKIDALLSDSALPRTTPSDSDLYNAINTNAQYTFGDETRLKLAQEFNQQLGIQANTPALEDDETLTTAWKFPVDTNNNGKYDSFTLYGIYFRSPSRINARNSLEARTPPMEEVAIDDRCYTALGTSATPVGDWYKSSGKLKKSFFVFVASVPITTPPPDSADKKYEPYKGNQGFSALEFQQDRSLIPLNNNAVWFQNDLEITPNTPFRINGRVQTNGNLLVGGHQDAFIQFYQVSSKNSCFYKQENAKMTVGGNVGTGNVTATTDQAAVNVNDRTDPGSVVVDLYSDYADESNPSFKYIGGIYKSTNSNGGSQIAYNNIAYNQRIALMKQTALSAYYCTEYGIPCSEDNPPLKTTVAKIKQYPEEIKSRFAARVNENPSLNTYKVLSEELEIYLKSRTRRVPYAEIPAASGTNANFPYNNTGDNIDINVFGDPASQIEPPEDWRQPIDVNNQLTNTNPAIAINPSQLEANSPEQQRQQGEETLIGDRVIVGNNLPAYWKKDKNYVTEDEQQLLGKGINWTKPNDKPRYRTTQVQNIDEGISDRDGFWEEQAANLNDSVANFGGLRVITGAGIYFNSLSTYPALSTASFVTPPVALDSGAPIPNVPILAGNTTPTPYTLVWPDTMPMSGGVDDPNTTPLNESTAPPDLRMRATAVYHYKQSSGINQVAIACVSSYYDPTDATTAQNGKYNTQDNLPWGDNGNNLPPNPDLTAPAGSGRSNNGVVYPTPYDSDAGRFSAIATYLTELKAQAQLMFPNGRIVNEPLQQALKKLSAGGGIADTTKPLTLSEISAIDTAICAIKIVDGTLIPSTNPVLPHGAIKEASFLDAREVKAIDKNATSYDLELEQRQPLEIRVTEINLSTNDTQGITRKEIVTNLDTSRTIGANEYILPNSGIIYASRDDALLDLSDTSPDIGTRKLLSPTDFNLDSNRRPNGIRLINGSDLSRLSENIYREAEKGLILATNLPVYVKGDFNLHRQPGGSTDIEEFRETLVPNWDNFYTRTATLDPNYACRPGKPGCPTISNTINNNGDTWRPATVISDAITLLSNTFQDGFRNQGDFDLSNNTGSSVSQIRNKSGFWENSFVTSAVWNPNNTNNAYPTIISSYLTNGVTPIQRRGNFTEYVMEICRNLPVSTCTSSDWVVTIGVTDKKASDVIGTLAPLLQTGTTATPATNPVDQRYARRVAFLRNRRNDTLLLNSTDGTPTPLIVDSNGKVANFIYPNTTTAPTNPPPNTTTAPNTTTTIPNPANNALWFRTTTNTSGKPFCKGINDPIGFGCTSDDRSYANNQPLYYDVSANNRLFSPPTPDIPGVPSLNLPASNPASSYTICTGTSSSKKYLITSTTPLELGSCSSEPGNPMAQIQAALQGFLNLQPDDAPNSNNLIRRAKDIPQAQSFIPGTDNVIFTSSSLTSTQPVVNVIDIAGDFNTIPNNITMTLVGNENSIFVFRKTGNLNFGNVSRGTAVTLKLAGVDPNNVFWAINGSVQWNTPHPSMHGTFLTNSTVIPNLNNINGAQELRLLGFSGIPTSSPTWNIKAIASMGQPSLVPVLQIHSPDGSPGQNNELDRGSGQLQDKWIQAANTNTTFNAAFVSGNSPSRAIEEPAGLDNFVRFLENWQGTTTNIKGSFIQLKRSAYSTAPFAPITSNNVNANNGSLSLFDPTGNSTLQNTPPYYSEPTRQWSFDVGLLSQSPDLFAQKFTQQPVTSPDEFFREIDRNDSWIQTLLCAADASDRLGEQGATYTQYAITDKNQRPSRCQNNTADYPPNQ